MLLPFINELIFQGIMLFFSVFSITCSQNKNTIQKILSNYYTWDKMFNFILFN